MLTRPLRLLLLCLVPCLLWAELAPAEEVKPFEASVRPLLKAYCFECHGEGEKLQGGLDLRLVRLMQKGGKSGPALVPGKAEQSLVWQKLAHDEMPPGKKKLTPDQKQLLHAWLQAGAQTARAEPETLALGWQPSPDERAHWAYQPITRPALPKVSSPLLRSPIDAFVLAQLQAKGLSFAPEADKRTLLRRASFALLGQPPSPEEQQLFLTDSSANAYESMLERLLASPHYGERWGRHWLDVAGYADSEGYTQDDPVRPNAYRYRDYVIRSLNADKPLSTFIHEQLAGDELVKTPYANLSQDDIEKLVATGFLRMAPDGTASAAVEQKQARNQVVSDTLKIVSSAFLGLTVQCAQCHNHRYDPLPQTDYYRLRALFEPAYDVSKWKTPANRQLSLYSDADRKQAASIEAEAAKINQEATKLQQKYIEETLEKQLAKLDEKLREPLRAAWKTVDAKRTAEQKKLLKEHPSVNVSAGSLYLYDSKAAAEVKKLADEAGSLRAKKPVEEFVRILSEVPGQVPTTYLFQRGDPEHPKQPIEPGGLRVLDDTLPIALETPAPTSTTHRRLAFARWLTDEKQPLTARVLANRVWHQHFGRGIVASVADFGVLGDKPTHPELLDWLACELQQNRWSLKHLHRQIMTSTVYRQTTQRESQKDTLDPDNLLLGRMSVRRLEAEAVRDSVLTVAGSVNRRLFGAPVPIKENDAGLIVVGIENKDGAGRFLADKPLPVGEAERRSIYVQVRRSKPLGLLEAFDWATPEPCCEKRAHTTSANQALFLMNNEFLTQQAELLALRLVKQAGDTTADQVKLAWALVFSAEPTPAELCDAMTFVLEQEQRFQKAPGANSLKPAHQRALSLFCQALLSSNRFLYVD